MAKLGCRVHRADEFLQTINFIFVLLELLVELLLSFEFQLQVFNLSLLRIALLLLLFDGIDQDDVDAVILDAFDLALLVVSDQQRINLLDVFGAKPRSRIPPSFHVKLMGRSRLTIERPLR